MAVGQRNTGTLVRTAAARGARFVVSTDSHSVRDLDNMVYGVGQARRGGLGPEAVLNTRPVEGLPAALKDGRAGRRPAPRKRA